MKKVVKIVVSAVLAVAFLMCVSMLWHVGLVIMLLFIWRKPVKRLIGRYWPSGYYVLWGILWTGFAVSLPRYVPLPMDRVRLYYTEGDRIVAAPFSHWLLNAVLPEEELYVSSG